MLRRRPACILRTVGVPVGIDADNRAIRPFVLNHVVGLLRLRKGLGLDWLLIWLDEVTDAAGNMDMILVSRPNNVTCAFRKTCPSQPFPVIYTPICLTTKQLDQLSCLTIRRKDV